MDEPHDKAESAARGTTRKLAAILHADVVGYTRLMAADEEGTHARLVMYRDLIGEIIAEHGGRLVGTAGDALLIEFASVVDAVRSSIAIQEKLVAQNQSVEADKRVEFRIGVNLGDVIIDDDDIFGDGVNIAQRVEALAEPNNIAVSGPVFDQLQGREEFSFRGGGTVRVKNVRDPIRVYFVQTPGSDTTLLLARPPRRRLLLAAMAIAGLVMLAGAGATWWLNRTGLSFGSGNTEVEQGRPIVAVLPFRTRTQDPDRSFFGEGMTEDVIAELSRYSNLLVLSWNAVAQYKAGDRSPDQVSRDLGADYVASGSMSEGQGRLRLTVELTDPRRGVLLWSERYDESVDDVFAVQDRVARKIVEALAVGVTRSEYESARSAPTNELEAYELVLQGRELMRRNLRDATFDARKKFERALEIDPNYADALVWFGWTHLYDFLYGWAVWPDRSVAAAQKAAEDALVLDSGNADAHVLVAYTLIVRGRFDEAQQHVDRAIKLNPSNSLALSLQARLLVMGGRPDEALPLMELVMRLDPDPGGLALFAYAQALYSIGNDQEVVDTILRYPSLLAEDSALLAILAAAQAQLGLKDAVADTVGRLRRINPFFNAEHFVRNLSRPPLSTRLAEGLDKAGLNQTGSNDR